VLAVESHGDQACRECPQHRSLPAPDPPSGIRTISSRLTSTVLFPQVVTRCCGISKGWIDHHRRNTWVRVAKTGLRVTEAIHEEAENLRRSGTFTAYFVELDPPRDATDTEALFPSQFHRRVGETRIIGPDGAVGDEPTYEPAQSAPGDYEVLWKSVSYATGGVFDSDHEITMDDFRRERQRAQDRFTIPADSGANG
jgi:hypothetical protein